MSGKVKIILFVFIGIGICALIAYGLVSSKKLEKEKLSAVDSNIEDFIYDESKDTLTKKEKMAEDLDGDDAEVEDDDFEVYQEDGGWGDEEESSFKEEAEELKSKIMDSNGDDEFIDDGELEELYDNTVEEQSKPKPIVEKPVVEENIIVEKPIKTKPSLEDNFLVIVGRFKSKTNANKKLGQLKKADVTGEIVQLENSKLYTVVAGRFETEAAGEILVSNLKEQGLKAFVKDLNQ